MMLTAVFVLVVGCTWAHGSKLINQHDIVKPGLTPEEVLKHALINKGLDKKISDAKKEVGEAKGDKADKKSKHTSAVQGEQNAIKAEIKAENAEKQARTQKEEAQGAKSAAKKEVEILEGKTAAVVQVEEATENLNAANSKLATAKATRTQHLHAVAKATEERTQAIKNKEDAESAEEQASIAASKAALDLQTYKNKYMAAHTFCETAKLSLPEYSQVICSVVPMTQKDVKDGEDAKKAADDKLVEAKQAEADAVDALAEAHKKKSALDKLTGNIKAAVDEAETKKVVAQQALEKAIQQAHKHFTSKQEIEEAKSDNLRKKVEKAKQELEAAKEAFNQAKEKADQAAQELEDAEEATAEATRKKHAAKSELEKAQLRLEMAQSNLSAAQGDLENAQKDAKEQLALAKKRKEEAQQALNEATQVLDQHNTDKEAAAKTEKNALQKLAAAEAHHAAKVTCQQGSQAALDEADAIRRHADYWSSHTEILQKEHYWDGEFGSIHQAANTILEDKTKDYNAAKAKNEKHIAQVQEAHEAMSEARQTKDQAVDAWMKLDSQTPLLQDNFVKAESQKNDAEYRHDVAKAIHKVYH